MKLRPAALTFVALFVAGCASSTTHEPGGPYYFAGFGCDYSIPLCPIEPIEEASLESHSAYVEAHFDSEGRISHFIKRLHGKVQFEHRYRYDESGHVSHYEILVPGRGPEIRSVRP